MNDATTSCTPLPLPRSPCSVGTTCTHQPLTFTRTGKSAKRLCYAHGAALGEKQASEAFVGERSNIFNTSNLRCVDGPLYWSDSAERNGRMSFICYNVAA